MKNISILGIAAVLAATTLLTGCGGNDPLNTIQLNQFTGRHNGDIVFEYGGRGGGPSMQLQPLIVTDDNAVGGTATFQDENGSHQGKITGTLTPDGKLNLAVNMNNMVFTAAGHGLKWTQTRGGPARYVDGTITVTQKYNDSPYGQAWANSRIMFWNENE